MNEEMTSTYLGTHLRPFIVPLLIVTIFLIQFESIVYDSATISTEGKCDE